MEVLKLLFLMFWFSCIVCVEATDTDYDDYNFGESFINDRSRLWTNGRIPYIFTNDVNGRYSEDQKSLIREVMRRMESQLGAGCIQFVEVDVPCEVCLKFNKAKLECYAYIGMHSNSTATFGIEECFSDNGRTIQHELGHVLGLVHEQNRPDRDDFVEILTHNLPNPRHKAWGKKPNRFGDTYETPYDFFSFMHYPKAKGSRDGKDCIKVKQPYADLFNSGGQKILESYPENLSPVDIYEIWNAYPHCTIKLDVMVKYIEYVKKITTAQAAGSYSCTDRVDKNKMKKLEYFDGNLYYFHPNHITITWLEAENYCNTWFNAHLTSIHSQKEYEFIVNNLKLLSKNPHSWIMIGGHRVGSKWYWTDKTSIDWLFSDNSHWSPGEPNNSKNLENSLEMNWVYDFNDLPGDNTVYNHRDEYVTQRRKFVCKISCI